MIAINCIESNKPVPDQCLKYFECDHGICTVRCCNSGDKFSKFDLVCITVDACREDERGDCCLKSISTTTSPLTTVWCYKTVRFYCWKYHFYAATMTDLDIQETSPISSCTVTTLVMNVFVIITNMTLTCLLYEKLSGNSRKMMTKFQDLKVLFRLGFKLIFQIHLQVQ